MKRYKKLVTLIWRWICLSNQTTNLDVIFVCFPSLSVSFHADFPELRCVFRQILFSGLCFPFQPGVKLLPNFFLNERSLSYQWNAALGTVLHSVLFLMLMKIYLLFLTFRMFLECLSKMNWHYWSDCFVHYKQRRWKNPNQIHTDFTAGSGDLSV